MTKRTITPGPASSAPMTPLERRSVAVLASIYGFRIFGLFLVFPVFAPYAATLAPHAPILVGLALGIYGLTQAMLQIPSGMASDVFGRKAVMTTGLVVFAIGSFVAGVSHGIWGLVLGRAIQGAGAISAATMALTADLTRESQRTKAMAVIGVTIGGAFSLSMVLSPVLQGSLGVPGIFQLTAVLAVIAIGLLWWKVPNPERPLTFEPSAELRDIIRDRRLWPLDAGIFFLHMTLTALFVVLPGTLVATTGIPLARQWEIYLPVIGAAFLTMGPFIHLGHRAPKKVIFGAVGLLVLAECAYAAGHNHTIALAVGMWLFFTGFSLLESVFPSLISRLVPGHSKGAAIGVYSTSQFSGAFLGGFLGGALAQGFGAEAVFAASLIVTLIWMGLAFLAPEPTLLESRQIRLSRERARSADIVHDLSTLPGVIEVVVVPDEGLAYLKIDPKIFADTTIRPFTA
ncbi:MAG: MFS transporter [Gammaproteobacteria bacterium]|nr:MFS transporter [Gammaproteobacteria bacterium]